MRTIAPKRDTFVALAVLFAVSYFFLWTPAAVAKVLPQIVVSVRPLALLVQDICQHECQVKALVPQGQSEHHWEPGPRDIVEAKSAVAAIGIGLSFDEKWFARILGDHGRLQKINPILLGKDLSPEQTVDDGHAILDPHLWFDPVRMASAVPIIVSGLAVALPASKHSLEANGATTLARLKALDIDILKLREHWRDTPVLMFHDALKYWVSRYHIKIDSLGGAGADHELSAKTMAMALKKYRSTPPLAIVVERKDGVAENLARELKTPLVVFDLAAVSDQASYYDWLLRLARSWDAFASTNRAGK